MTRLLWIVLCLHSGLLFAGEETLLPMPQRFLALEGELKLNSEMVISIPEADHPALRAAGYLSQLIEEETGIHLTVKDQYSPFRKNAIQFALSSGNPGSEEYRLRVDSAGIRIESSGKAGFFYATVTLSQLINESKIPYCEISDYPRFGWRGFMLDEARSFYGKEYVKELLDRLANYKFNRFHWHLSDDQGWRIQIDSMPELTRTGAWRTEKNGEHYGGFYTKEDIREIVAYAKERMIEVIPELDMPGHTRALLAAYPQYSCTSGPFTVSNVFGVHRDVLCPGNEETFRMAQSIYQEVFELFPFHYVHIGGDECSKRRWKECLKCQQRIRNEKLGDEFGLQSYFIRRMESFFQKNGKTLIGWNEILQGGISRTAVIMNWENVESGIRAAQAGHLYIASPQQYTYFCYGQNKPPLETVYHFEPEYKGLNNEEKKLCLGLQGVFFSEGVKSSKGADRLIWPRNFAIAEIAWSSQKKDYPDFLKRLALHQKRLEKIQSKSNHSD